MNILSEKENSARSLDSQEWQSSAGSMKNISALQLIFVVGLSFSVVGLGLIDRIPNHMHLA